MKELVPVNLFAPLEVAVNFQVHYPTWLPEDCEVISATVRPEQPPGRAEGTDEEALGLCPWTQGNPSSLRVVISGKDRKLRIKQFFYDWAPPAAGVPSLWESPSILPFISQQEVAWLGTDYKNNRAACVQRNTTQIELSVLEGVFKDQELMDIVNGLVPQEIPSNVLVQEKNYFKRSYWYRYQQEGIKVPHGLLQYNARHFFDKSTLVTLEEIEAGQLPKSIGTFQFNAALKIQDATSGLLEYEALYLAEHNQSDQLWLHIEHHNPKFSIEFPMEKDDHPFECFEIEIVGEMPLYLASLDKKFGGHEAFWQWREYSLAIWTTATTVLDFEEFKEAMQQLVELFAS